MLVKSLCCIFIFAGKKEIKIFLCCYHIFSNNPQMMILNQKWRQMKKSKLVKRRGRKLRVSLMINLEVFLFCLLVYKIWMLAWPITCPLHTFHSVLSAADGTNPVSLFKVSLNFIFDLPWFLCPWVDFEITRWWALSSGCC